MTQELLPPNIAVKGRTVNHINNYWCYHMPTMHDEDMCYEAFEAKIQDIRQNLSDLKLEGKTFFLQGHGSTNPISVRL